MTVTLTTVTSPNVTLSASRVTLSDSATLSGGSNPTGDIVFTLTEPGGSIFTETVTVNGNGTYTIPTGFTLPAAGPVVGTYSWTAQYTGDANNTSSNASVAQTVVSPASPALNTTASPGGGLALTDSPATLTDTAQLLGGYFPTGTIIFTLTGPGGFLFTQTDTVSSGNGPYTAATTLPTTGTVAGTYSWTAHYIGDANNNPSNASVAQTVVSPASPGLSTTASPGGVAGTTVTDIAHLSGGYFPTGTIIFLLTAPGGRPLTPR